MSFNGVIGLKSKEDLMNEYYEFHIESLKQYSPLSERDLYPFVTDGVDEFKYDLSICLLYDIELKNKRSILKNHREDIIDDEDIIKEELYDYYVTNPKQMEFYGDIDDESWGIDGDWFNIINNYCWEEYGFRFTDYEVLKVQVNNAKMNSCKVDNMCYWLAKKVNVNKKFDSWQQILEFKD